jgi:hypothetical protein
VDFVPGDSVGCFAVRLVSWGWAEREVVAVGLALDKSRRGLLELASASRLRPACTGYARGCFGPAFAFKALWRTLLFQEKLLGYPFFRMGGSETQIGRFQERSFVFALFQVDTNRIGYHKAAHMMRA